MCVFFLKDRLYAPTHALRCYAGSPQTTLYRRLLNFYDVKRYCMRYYDIHLVVLRKKGGAL
jgi:hypothetical protein